MKPFQKGADCFNKGRLGNPYPPTTTDHRDWEYGFNKAYFINLKKVKEHEQRNISIRSKEVHSKETHN
jgi:hypothetical protein